MSDTGMSSVPHTHTLDAAADLAERLRTSGVSRSADRPSVR
ncbi:hypothetical protein AB0P36_15845 [Streptomyces flavidovirens]